MPAEVLTNRMAAHAVHLDGCRARQAQGCSMLYQKREQGTILCHCNPLDLVLIEMVLGSGDLFLAG
jgi:hypothetical protein